MNKAIPDGDMGYAAAMGYALFLMVGLGSVRPAHVDAAAEARSVMGDALGRPLSGPHRAIVDRGHELMLRLDARGVLELAGVYAALVIVLLETLYPLFWVLFGSLKTKQNMLENIWGRHRALNSKTMPTPGKSL